MIVNYYADQCVRIINKGYNIGKPLEQVEEYRNKYTKNRRH